MDLIFSAFDLTGPAADLKTVGFFGLGLALIFAAAVLVAQIFNIRLGGGLTMIDATYFGFGVGLPLLGYVCGVILRLILDGLSIGGEL